ncbi:MAG: hypothetical protein ACRD1T_25960, partial [Acidimicrobiia bacterium]
MMACKEDLQAYIRPVGERDIRSGHDGICAFWFLIGRPPRRVITLGGIAERRSNLLCHHVLSRSFPSSSLGMRPSKLQLPDTA